MDETRKLIDEIAAMNKSVERRTEELGKAIAKLSKLAA